MIAAMLISGSIGWFVLSTGQPILEIVFWRCLIGGVALSLICLKLGAYRRRLTGLVTLLAVAGGVAIVLNWLLLFGSYGHASIAISTAVYSVQPFILFGFGALMFGERITIAKLGWLVLAFAGMLAIVLTKPAASYMADGNYPLGIAMALLAALCWAASAITTKRLRAVPPHLIALIHVVTGALMLAPVVNWSSLPRDAGPWSIFLTIGVVHSGIMYALLYAAVQRLPTDLQGALSFIYPVVAILIDVAAMGTILKPVQVAGIVAIISPPHGRL